MTAISSVLYAISLVSLAHAGYSAMEFTSFAKIAGSTLSPTLPLDIKLETILGISLFCLAIVQSQKPNLSPASYSEWSGEMRRKFNDDTFPNIVHRPNFVSFENARNTIRKKSLAAEKKSSKQSVP